MKYIVSVNGEMPLVLKTDPQTTSAHRSLSGNKQLDALPVEVLESLRPHLGLVKLRRGQILWDQGFWLQNVYFLTRGVVSILMTVGEATIEVATIGCEGAAGAPILLFEGSEATALGSALVLTDGLAMQMSARVLREQARQNAALSDQLLRYVRARYATIVRYAACNGLHNMEGRLARWLLEIADRVEDNVLELSHAQIATALGVRRASVSLALADFKRAGLIELLRGHIVIQNRAGLEAASCGCYFAIKQEYETIGHVP